MTALLDPKAFAAAVKASLLLSSPGSPGLADEASKVAEAIADCLCPVCPVCGVNRVPFMADCQLCGECFVKAEKTRRELQRATLSEEELAHKVGD
jgi:hypothetical protein